MIIYTLLCLSLFYVSLGLVKYDNQLIRNQGCRLMAISVFVFVSQFLLPVMTFSLVSTLIWSIIGLTIHSYILQRQQDRAEIIDANPYRT